MLSSVSVDALELSGSARRDLLAGSFLLSADNAHGVHPNHPEKIGSYQPSLLKRRYCPEVPGQPEIYHRRLFCGGGEKYL